LARRKNRGVGRDLVGADQPSHGKDEDGRKDTFLDHTREPPGLFAHRGRGGGGFGAESVWEIIRLYIQQISCRNHDFKEAWPEIARKTIREARNHKEDNKY
jgi:hypothetical protein